jgi:formiminotetrahydrofolate cyclodeaminase
MAFTKLSCTEFITELASKAPVPGGGGASALVAAVGAALGNMVGSLTVGKKKYAHVQEDILALKARTDKLQAELLALVERDAEVFEPLSRAYGLPKNTPQEQAEKTQVMEAALKDASAVPLTIMEKCGEAIELHHEFAAKGARIVISDVGVGVAFCKAAMQGASLNVFINTKAMQDQASAEEINRRANALLAKYLPMADAIYASVAARFL